MSLILHIGPHKTASTAIRHALYQRRRELTAAGTSYPVRHRDAQPPGAGGSLRRQSRVAALVDAAFPMVSTINPTQARRQLAQRLDDPDPLTTVGLSAEDFESAVRLCSHGFLARL